MLTKIDSEIYNFSVHFEKEDKIKEFRGKLQ